ncbi:hypothetical protein ACW4TU_44205 [Streptomyces sp. QTS52]
MIFVLGHLAGGPQGAKQLACPAAWDADANDYAVEAAKQHPGRFATLGWFPLDEAADDSLVDAWLDKPGGMLGLRIMPAAPGVGRPSRVGRAPLAVAAQAGTPARSSTTPDPSPA